MTWEREIPEEGAKVVVNLLTNEFSASISPSISVYSHHMNKRIAASVYFEIISKYAERVGGEVVQRGLVTGCRPVNSGGDLVLAHYPATRVTWDNVCDGFKAVLLGEHIETTDEEERGTIPT